MNEKNRYQSQDGVCLCRGEGRWYWQGCAGISVESAVACFLARGCCAAGSLCYSLCQSFLALMPCPAYTFAELNTQVCLRHPYLESSGQPSRAWGNWIPWAVSRLWGSPAEWQDLMGSLWCPSGLRSTVSLGGMP